jgi:hypothetical protein
MMDFWDWNELLNFPDPSPFMAQYTFPPYVFCNNVWVNTKEARGVHKNEHNHFKELRKKGVWLSTLLKYSLLLLLWILGSTKNEKSFRNLP